MFDKNKGFHSKFQFTIILLVSFMPTGVWKARRVDIDSMSVSNFIGNYKRDCLFGEYRPSSAGIHPAKSFTFLITRGTLHGFALIYIEGGIYE